MNEFLKNIDQIHSATKWLNENNYIEHPISCKNFELAEVIKNLTDGDMIDLGADGSFVLHNAIKKGTIGRKVGIDLIEVTGDNKAEGAEYFKGDLMKTPFKDGEFDIVISLSTIEHEVDLTAFSKEVSRLLRPDGQLIVSFDYWPTKIDTTGKLLYGLRWNILDENAALDLIGACAFEGLVISSVVSWSTKDAVITPQYCSPFPGIYYTFGILQFIKQ